MISINNPKKSELLRHLHRPPPRGQKAAINTRPTFVTLPQTKTKQTGRTYRRPDHGRPGTKRANHTSPGQGRRGSARNRPGPSKGPGRKHRRYHAHTPPLTTAERTAEGAPTTDTGEPARQRTGAEEGSIGTDTQEKPPARLTTHHRHPAGRREAQAQAN